MGRKKTIKAAADYAMYLYPKLGITDWSVFWKMRPPDGDDSIAEVECTEGRKTASIYLCEDFADMDADVIHMTLIHELLHIVERDSLDVIRVAGNNAGMAQAAYDVLMESFRLQRELMVDHLAHAFADLIPIKKKLMKAIKESS